MESIGDILRNISKLEVIRDNSTKEELKTVQLSKDQKALVKLFRDEAKQAKSMLEEAKKIMDKAATLRSQFWSSFEIDQGMYSNDMKISDDGTEVVIYKEEKIS